MSDYTTYTVADFIDDAHFLKWIQGNHPETNAFWENYLNENPDKVQAILEAKNLVLGLQTTFEASTIAYKNVDVMLSYQKIQDKIQQKQIKKLSIRRNLLIAASILFLLPATYWVWKSVSPQEIIFQTAFGQTQTVQLPDGSQVILNANSRVSYTNTWDKARLREVNLTGEAYFKVQKNPQKPFIVHTASLNVEVLGTQFNVKARNTETQVVLSSGKVKVTGLQTKDKSEILSVPGDMVSLTSDSRFLKKQQANLKGQTAWKDGLLKFDRIPLQKVFQTLEDNYGYTIIVKDTSLLKEEFVGGCPADKVELLIYSLSKILDIEKDNKKLIIKGFKE